MVQTIDVAEQRALAAELHASYLVIQGPPGTGKTWRGARLLTGLMRRRGGHQPQSDGEELSYGA